MRQPKLLDLDRAMRQPRLLDLFSGAGGAAAGYKRAGFYVVGVDIRPQPRYCYGGDEFYQCDVFKFWHNLADYDAIHASPPCQAFTALRTMPNAKPHPDLIRAVRRMLKASGRPYVIENVPGAPLRKPGMLCGTAFDLGVGAAQLRRHRLFETNWPLTCPPCRHDSKRPAIAVTGTGHALASRPKAATVNVWGHAGGSSTRSGRQMFSTAERKEAMGIDWMTGAELSQAIPPAFTEWVGKQLIARIYLEWERRTA